MANETHSTPQLVETLRTRVLTFVPKGLTTPISSDLTNLYYAQPPENLKAAAYPFGVLRVTNQAIQGAASRLQADLELTLFGRPQAKRLGLELIADRVVASLITYRGASTGIVMCTLTARDTLEPPPPPGDRDLVQIRLLFQLLAYPQFLTQYAEFGA